MSESDRIDRTAGLQPFPFADLEQRTDGCMARIRAETRRIAEQTKAEIFALRREVEKELDQREKALDAEREDLARKSAELAEERERLRNDVFEEARKLGWEEGKKEGTALGYAEGKESAASEWSASFDEERQRRLNELSDSFLPALDAVTRNLGELRQSLLAHWEANILQIAAAIAHQTISRELPSMPELPLDLLRESMELAVGCTAVKIRMNPGDLEALRPQIETMLAGFGPLTKTELAGDPKISRGGCVVETSLGTIDQRLESRLERIISELSK